MLLLHTLWQVLHLTIRIELWYNMLDDNERKASHVASLTGLLNCIDLSLPFHNMLT